MLIWTSNKARKFPLFDLSLALLSSLCTLEAMDCFLQMNALYNTIWCSSIHFRFVLECIFSVPTCGKKIFASHHSISLVKEFLVLTACRTYLCPPDEKKMRGRQKPQSHVLVKTNHGNFSSQPLWKQWLHPFIITLVQAKSVPGS